MKDVDSVFFAGICFLAGADLMKQDLYGLDRYLDHIRASWFDTHWTLGAFIMLAGLVMWQLISRRARPSSNPLPPAETIARQIPPNPPLVGSVVCNERDDLVGKIRELGRPIDLEDLLGAIGQNYAGLSIHGLRRLWDAKADRDGVCTN